MNDPKPPAPGADESGEPAVVPPSNDTVAAPQTPITPTESVGPAAVDGTSTGNGASAPAPTPPEPVTDTVVRPAAPVTGEIPIDMVPPPPSDSPEAVTAPPAAVGAQPPPPGASVSPPPDAPPPGSAMPTPPPGYGPPGMTLPGQSRPSRPGPVIAVMVMLWVQVGLAFLGAALVALLVLLSVADGGREDSGDFGSFVSRSAIASGTFVVLSLLFFGAVMVVAAILLIKRIDFARTLTIAVMGFFVFSNLSVIIFTILNALLVGIRGEEQVLLLVVLPLLAAAMPAAILVLLALKPAVTWFHDDNRMPAER